MQVILNSKQIESVIDKLALQISGDIPKGVDVVVIGVRSRGEILAGRLAGRLGHILGKAVPCGTLDITLYRDDLNDPHSAGGPAVRSTEIPFDINGAIVLLVDDVLYTGRSVRAAMDALIDLGRPRAIRLAVLVDRGHHELPIQADYPGHKVDIPDEKSVEVNFVETDDKDQVIVR